jgi:hypothetical protein
MSSAIDFLNKHGIKWQPVKIIFKKKKNGKVEKTPVLTGCFQPKQSDFHSEMISDKELMIRQMNVELSEYIAVDTSRILQIDIDEKEYVDKEPYVSLMKKTPYFLSATKKLPHLFIKCEKEMEDCVYKLKDGAGELLSKQWSYMRKDAKVYNDSLPFHVFNDLDNIVKPSVKSKKKEVEVNADQPIQVSTQSSEEGVRESRVVTATTDSPTTLSTLRKVVMSLSVVRADDYNYWIRVLWAIINVCDENGYKAEAKLLCHDFSKKSAKYDAVAVDNILNKAKGDGGLRMGTLVKYLYEDNPTVYEEYMNAKQVVNETDDSICKKWKKYCDEHGVLETDPVFQMFNLECDLSEWDFFEFMKSCGLLNGIKAVCIQEGKYNMYPPSRSAEKAYEWVLENPSRR